MATIKDLPYELLYHIIFLLVQSSGGAEEFARIIAVCRDFLLYAENESILKVVNFDIKMEFVNFYRFQNVKGLLVKCSEAGNVAAQHVLGKVILLSSTHMFLSKCHQERFGVRPCDRSELNRWILDINVPDQNNKVSSFMNYFSPVQVNSSEYSPTRLVHHQLVKLFLLNASHHDFIEMGLFLKYCIKYFMGVIRENKPLIASIMLLIKRAFRVRSIENLVETKESFDNYFMGVREYLEVKMKNLDENFEDASSGQSGNSSENIAVEAVFLLELYMWKCVSVGANWKEAASDMNFIEALRETTCDQLNVVYAKFARIRAQTLGHFERRFG